VTIHAGEAYGPASIAQALHVCGAHRIGHGCRLREDGDLLRYVVDHRIPLECCPSSNVQTGAVTSIAEHPVRLYFNLGARITINTDNRLITDTTVSKELHHIHTQLDFDFAELRQVILNGFKSAFLPYHEKRRFMRAISTELDEFAKQLGVGAGALPADAGDDAAGAQQRGAHDGGLAGAAGQVGGLGGVAGDDQGEEDQAEAGDDEAEAHQGDGGAQPGEQGAFIGEVVAQAGVGGGHRASLARPRGGAMGSARSVFGRRSARTSSQVPVRVRLEARATWRSRMSGAVRSS
jgi:hypothetical protein